MIVALNGRIEKKEPTRIWLEIGGITYEVFTSINTSDTLSGESARLLITHIIREDAWQLYGFASEGEKHVFDTLIKINGVGPKVALAILSTYTPATFSQIVESKDVKALQRVPGIGPKSAGRIMVELAGFSLSVRDSAKDGGSLPMHEAMLALESLGFKSDAVQKALQNISVTNTQEIIKEALKRLQTLR
ncbi:MAG: Holliday junction branch migration protein RuvA [Wolinella sp.]